MIRSLEGLRDKSISARRRLAGRAAGGLTVAVLSALAAGCGGSSATAQGEVPNPAICNVQSDLASPDYSMPEERQIAIIRAQIERQVCETALKAAAGIVEKDRNPGKDISEHYGKDIGSGTYEVRVTKEDRTGMGNEATYTATFGKDSQGRPDLGDVLGVKVFFPETDTRGEILRYSSGDSMWRVVVYPDDTPSPSPIFYPPVENSATNMTIYDWHAQLGWTTLQTDKFGGITG